MSEKVSLSPGEKLILLMLCDLQDHLKVKSDTDTALVREAIYSGNLWGLEWGMPGIFHGHETPSAVVLETTDILAMWERLEQSYENLSQTDKDWLASNVDLYGGGVLFSGFDGNTESEYGNAADFLMKRLDRFPHFKGRRDMNSHMPTLDAHRRMLVVFKPIIDVVLNRDFTAAQIAQVLAVWRSPNA